MQLLFSTATSDPRGAASERRASVLTFIVLAAAFQGCGSISNAPNRAAPALPSLATPGDNLTPSGNLSNGESPADKLQQEVPSIAKIPSPPEIEEAPPIENSPAPEQPAFAETGLASYYGARFHGKLTASGEIFRQDKFTAAHRTLPWGSRVKVTNLANGKSVEVRINDRGPFEKGRIIDVSRAAAKALGMLKLGITMVRVEWLSGPEISNEVVLQDKAKDH